MVSAEFNGMEKLLEALKKFPERVQKNVMVGATRASASAIAKEAKKNVPEHDGILKKSIGLTRKKERNKALIGFSISPRKDIIVKNFQAEGLEKKSFVSKKTGFKYTNYDNYGGYLEFGTSKMAAHPYLRPAYELKGENSIKVFKEYAEKRIDKEIQKAKT